MSLRENASILIKKAADFAKRMLERRFVRFLIVGGVNTLLGYGVFALLVFLGMHYAAASLTSTVVGILFNFKTTGLFVFRSRRNSLVFRFFLVYCIVYFFNVGGLKLFALAGISSYIGGALLLLPAAVLSYVLNRSMVFRDKSNCRQPA